MRLPSAALVRVFLIGAALTGCDTVAQDDFRSQGGISPDPTAVLDGTVLYRGPAPACAYRRGKPVRVTGRVVLTLFRYDDPPPPEGRATVAENVLFVNGSELFSLADCAPEGATSETGAPITRSVPFRWPQLALFADARDYQVRGFFDADGNMNPFFSVTRLPTRGDVTGAAVVDADAPVPVMARVSLPAVDEAENGYVAKNLLVTLGRVVRSERPAFRLGEARTLSSEDRLDVPLDPEKLRSDPASCFTTPYACVDRALLLERLRAASCGDEESTACDLSLYALGEDEAEASYAAAGLSPSFAPLERAFFANPIDVKTVRVGEPDAPGPDGVPDPHPLLGASVALPWFSPAVLMQRLAPDSATAAREREAGIPDVVLVGSVLLDERGEAPRASVFAERVPFAVPPIAAVDLDPSRPDCRVPYIPPGNTLSAYEAVFAQCSELPTGLYGVSVLAGVAGGELRVDARSELGVSYAGGTPSGQSWSLPNELADPVQVGAEAVLSSQGRDGLFVVYDPRPDDSGDCTRAPSASAVLLGGEPALVDVQYRGLCGDDAPALFEAGPGVDAAGCLPQPCCEAIAHLCGIPLCPVCDASTCPELAARGLAVRLGPSALQVPPEGGRKVPDCVPFRMPSACCPDT